MAKTNRRPALFVAHGSPAVALEHDTYTDALARFGRENPRPAAIVIVSAHWEADGPVRVMASARPSLIYDFGGFPDALYRLTYAAPGQPALAAEIVERLEGGGQPATLETARGLDHGAWIPLRFLYPAADVPVVEVSQPVPRTPAQLMAIGAALAPLRDRDILLVGSGGIVHNLRRLDFERKDAPASDWARAFDAWVGQRLDALDFAGLAAYRTLAPDAALAVPTPEHFDPVFVVVGSAQPGERATSIFEGFHHGTLSMRSFAFAS